MDIENLENQLDMDQDISEDGNRLSDDTVSGTLEDVLPIETTVVEETPTTDSAVIIDETTPVEEVPSNPAWDDSTAPVQ